jgi:hypothetical protein
MPEIDTLDIAEDRLDGAQAIADFRGEELHRTRYLIRIGAIPVAREGERIVGSKRVLRERYLAAVSGTPLEPASQQARTQAAQGTKRPTPSPRLRKKALQLRDPNSFFGRSGPEPEAA